MKIKLIILLLIFCCLYNYGYSQTAQLEDINRNIRNEESELKKLKKEKQSVSKQISVVSSKINNYRKLIWELNKERQKVEKNIQTIRANITQVTKDINSSKKNIAKSNMYVIDNMGYSEIKIITTTNKVEDTVKLLEIMGKSSSNLKKQVDKLNQDIAKLKQLKVEEEARVYELETLENSRKSAINELNTENARYKSMLTMIKHDEAGRKEYIELLKYQRKELDDQIRLQAEKANNARPIAERQSSNTNNATPSRIRTFGVDKPITTTMSDNSAFGKQAGKLPMPLSGKIIEEYGEHLVADAGVKIMHKGIKIAPSSTADVKAVADGRIVFADNVKNFNNLVIIDHGSAYYTVYGNLDILSVKSGNKISKGSVLGQVLTDTGIETPHLYFELRKKEQALNPRLWFKKG